MEYERAHIESQSTVPLESVRIRVRVGSETRFGNRRVDSETQRVDSETREVDSETRFGNQRVDSETRFGNRTGWLRKPKGGFRNQRADSETRGWIQKPGFGNPGEWIRKLWQGGVGNQRVASILVVEMVWGRSTLMSNFGDENANKK